MHQDHLPYYHTASEKGQLRIMCTVLVNNAIIPVPKAEMMICYLAKLRSNISAGMRTPDMTFEVLASHVYSYGYEALYGLDDLRSQLLGLTLKWHMSGLKIDHIPLNI